MCCLPGLHLEVVPLGGGLGKGVMSPNDLLLICIGPQF